MPYATEEEELDGLEALVERYEGGMGAREYKARKKAIMVKWTNILKEEAGGGGLRVKAGKKGKGGRMLFESWTKVGVVKNVDISKAIDEANLKKAFGAATFNKYTFGRDYTCGRSGNTTIGGVAVKFRRMIGTPKDKDTNDGATLYVRAVQSGDDRADLEYQTGIPKAAAVAEEEEEEGEEEEDEEGEEEEEEEAAQEPEPEPEPEKEKKKKKKKDDEPPPKKQKTQQPPPEPEAAKARPTAAGARSGTRGAQKK